VGTLLESIEGCSADPESGGVGIVKLRVRFFEVFELAEKTVVFSVGDFRFGVLIVELVMPRELFAEFGDTVVEKHAVF
jgi:hypothetical protein